MERRNEQQNYERLQEAQIIRKDGNGIIFEVMDTSFNIGKVLLNFQKYDKNAPAGQKVQSRISIYLDFEALLRIAHDFTVTGNGPKRMAREKAAKEEKGEQYFATQIAMGGTGAAGLARQNRSRPDGKPEFRALSIGFSNKAGHYMLQAISGAGRQVQTGGFVMDGRPDNTVTLALSYADWAEVLLLTKASIEAFLAYKYAKRFKVLDAEYAARAKQARAPQQEPRAQQYQQPAQQYQQPAQQYQQPAQQQYQQAPQQAAQPQGYDNQYDYPSQTSLDVRQPNFDIGNDFEVDGVGASSSDDFYDDGHRY